MLLVLFVVSILPHFQYLPSLMNRKLNDLLLVDVTVYPFFRTLIWAFVSDIHRVYKSSILVLDYVNLERDYNNNNRSFCVCV